MSHIVDELRIRLNPIFKAKTAEREQEFISAIRNVNDASMMSGQHFGGSRRVLNLESVYNEELRIRGSLLWDTVMEASISLYSYKPLDLSEGFKHFISDNLESSRVELACDLLKRAGKQCLTNEAFEKRLEMHELKNNLLQSYGAKIDLWKVQKQTELKDAENKQALIFLQNILKSLCRLFKSTAGR